MCSAVQLQGEAAEGVGSEHSHHSAWKTSKDYIFILLISDLKVTNGSLNLSLSFISLWLVNKSLVFTEVYSLFKDTTRLDVVSP